MVEICDNPIDESALLVSVRTAQAGAVVLFLGTTREFTESLEAGDREPVDKQTTRLEYECYRPMAISEMQSLEHSARNRWSLCQVAIVHRIGIVPLAETSVAIAVSSRHRPEAFEAGRWLIDELKRKVPIWKKENWADGTRDWVHPDQTSVEQVDQ